ncbi:Chloroperoxidase [Mycena sp. CBHHK59/15]|nr:Chloroperoxidase [Mycena sp. CBHHK59/15]
MLSTLSLLTPLLVVPTCTAFPFGFFEDSAAPTGRSFGFNSQAQYVNVTGPHAYVAPGPGDERGPCPGLNSLANHNFIPHNGIVSFLGAIDASVTVYGLAVEGSTFAAALALFGADLISPDLQFSIGGPSPSFLGFGGILGSPTGLSYTHNQFESDSSATRGDFYQFNNNGHDLQVNYFQELYDLQPASPAANYNKSVIFKHRVRRFNQSIFENPYFFYGPVEMLVSSLTHCLIYALMSNHSTEYPDGILSNDILKSLYGISTASGQLVYTRGTERIPDNWNRRPLGDDYGAVHIIADVVELWQFAPQLLLVGGNTHGVNTYAPLDIANFTNGVYSAATLLDRNNAACFVFQATRLLVPDALNSLQDLVMVLVQKVVDAVEGMLAVLTCPELTGVNQAMLEHYPGYKRTNRPV